MLYRLKDAMVQTNVLATGDHDSRLLFFPASFNPAFRELDRALSRLRDADRTLWWHVRAWYVDPDWRQEAQYRWVVIGGNRRKVPAGWRMVAVRNRDAREETARAGVEWLARAYRFERIHLSALTEALGEGLASR